jgi:hypothetical protein
MECTGIFLKTSFAMPGFNCFSHEKQVLDYEHMTLSVPTHLTAEEKTDEG